MIFALSAMPSLQPTARSSTGARTDQQSLQLPRQRDPGAIADTLRFPAAAGRGDGASIPKWKPKRSGQAPC